VVNNAGNTTGLFTPSERGNGLNEKLPVQGSWTQRLLGEPRPNILKNMCHKATVAARLLTARLHKRCQGSDPKYFGVKSLKTFATAHAAKFYRAELDKRPQVPFPRPPSPLQP
jgi:hypothetical protein